MHKQPLLSLPKTHRLMKIPVPLLQPVYLHTSNDAVCRAFYWRMPELCQTEAGKPML